MLCSKLCPRCVRRDMRCTRSARVQLACPCAHPGHHGPEDATGSMSIQDQFQDLVVVVVECRMGSTCAKRRRPSPRHRLTSTSTLPELGSVPMEKLSEQLGLRPVRTTSLKVLAGDSGLWLSVNSDYQAQPEPQAWLWWLGVVVVQVVVHNRGHVGPTAQCGIHARGTAANTGKSA